MVLTVPTLVILLILGILQLAAGVLLGRMLPQTGRCRAHREDRRAELADAASRDQVAALVEQRLSRLLQLTAELHARLQTVEEQLALPVATGLAQDACDPLADPNRLARSLRARLAEIAGE